MDESVRTLIILILCCGNHQALCEEILDSGDRMVPRSGVCGVHTSELTSELLCEERKIKRQREAGGIKRTGIYWEKNMGKCSHGRMVSILSTYPDPSLRLRKCELLPDVRRSITGTHMTDALNRLSACSLRWALKFMGCSLDLQFYFPSPNEIRE